MLNLREEVERVMLKNRRVVDGHQFTLPSPITYPYQWLWDSCFHAIILSHINCEDAKAELRSLLARQHPDGFVGHVTYWETNNEQFRIDWGLEHTSNLTQPPIIAYAVWRVYEKTGDLPWLAEMYPKLQAYYDFLLQTRDLRDLGLLGIINPDESGEDNSPRFDTDLGVPAKHDASINTQKRYDLFHVHRDCGFSINCTSRTFWVEDAPFNAYVVWNLRILADMAEILNRPDDARQFRANAEHIGAAMREHMLIDGVFWSLSGLDGIPIRTKTTGMFIPLIAGLYTEEEADNLIETWLTKDETFWQSAGIATTAKDEPAYDPDEPTWGEAWQRPHWRGPIWFAPHWFIYHGLSKYGFSELAAEVSRKSLALLTQSGFREYFDPETGVGMGAEDFTWGGLVLDMVPTLAEERLRRVGISVENVK